jgi:hypothetical protein
LFGWVTGEAALNHGLIPELLHEDDARYFGEVPMVGFGAGAYVLAAIARNGTTTPGSDGGIPDAGADGGVDDRDAGGTDGDSGASNGDGDIISRSDAAGPERDASLARADSGGSATKASECSCTETHAAHAGPSYVPLFELAAIALSLAGVQRLRTRGVKSSEQLSG